MALVSRAPSPPQIGVGDVIEVYQDPMGVDGTYNDGCDGSNLTMTVNRASAGLTPGLCQQWWDVGNPGNAAGAFDIINGGNPNMGEFKNAGGSSWWTGNGLAVPGIPNYPPALGFGPGHNEESYLASLTGEILIPEDGDYKFKDGVDDYTYLAIDLDDNGLMEGDEILIDDNAWTGVEGNQNGGSPIVSVAGATAGWHSIHFIASEGGGGDAGILYWDYSPAGPGTGCWIPNRQ